MNIQSSTPDLSDPDLLAGRQRQDYAELKRGNLALVAASSRESYLAVFVLVIAFGALIVLVPFARVPLPRIPAFIPSYESALAVVDLVTAVLLFGRITRRQSRGYLALACGYLFNAVIIFPHMLSFPGAFSETGLLGANAQTTAWIFVFWHGGFPLFILAYALLPEQDGAANFLQRHPGYTIGLSIFGVLATVCALTLLATLGTDMLPQLMNGSNFALLISTGVSPATLVVSLLVLLALWRRPQRSALDVWLMVVMGVWLLEVTLSAVVSSSRYDLGWYAGRIFGLVSACCLLIVLLAEINRFYGRLNQALTASRALQEDFRLRAEKDVLTGLPNRALFYDRLATAMLRCQRGKGLMALFFVDIDHFKAINDGAGHGAGDALLRQFAQLLSDGVRASDTVARLGGDEFTVILENIESPEAAIGVVEKLMLDLRRPYSISPTVKQASASIGIAYYQGADIDADGLIRQADSALYQAKDRGRDGYWVYEPGSVAHDRDSQRSSNAA